METSTSKKLQSNDRKQAILKGAAAAFRAHGYEATSMMQISSAAQVSKVLIYRHFTSKKEIYEAILESFSSRVNDAEALSSQRGLEARLDVLVQAAMQYPDAFILMFYHVPREPEFAHYAAALQKKREQTISHKLAQQIVDEHTRDFYTHLLDDLTLGTLVTWVEKGMPYPHKVQQIISGILGAIITSMKG